MSWNNQGGGGGPWGGPGGQSPWGGRGRPKPPQFDEILRRGQDRFRGLIPGDWGRGSYVLIALAAIVVIWLASGFYRVEPDEQGVVLRFGALNRITEPGLNYHLPGPIESVQLPKVTRVNPIEIGFRLNTPGDYRVTAAGSQEVPEESLMLTGDENIVDINFTVFWVIKDATKYLFKIRNSELVVKAAAESAMREVIGHTDIARAFAEGRGLIKTDTEKLTQEILDSYDSGIAITDLQLQKVDPPGQVIDAFRDVQSAKIDLNTLVNQAQAYRNDIVPRAHGDAARVEQEAQAYRQQVVLKAQGEASRFISVHKSYEAAKDVTTTRLYLETLEAVLKSANKVILDKGAAGAGVLPYLPLPALKSPPAADPATRSGK